MTGVGWGIKNSAGFGGAGEGYFNDSSVCSISVRHPYCTDSYPLGKPPTTGVLVQLAVGCDMMVKDVPAESK